MKASGVDFEVSKVESAEAKRALLITNISKEWCEWESNPRVVAITGVELNREGDSNPSTMITEMFKTRAIAAQFVNNPKNSSLQTHTGSMVGVRAGGTPTMEPGKSPKIGYASCKATIGNHNRYENLKSTFPTSLCRTQPSECSGVFFATFFRAGVELNPARGRKLGALRSDYFSTPKCSRARGAKPLYLCSRKPPMA